jgi:hypothetical protein
MKETQASMDWSKRVSFCPIETDFADRYNIEPEYAQDPEQMKRIVEKVNAWNESQSKLSTTPRSK